MRRDDAVRRVVRYEECRALDVEVKKIKYREI
jgi:hypothetical protein